MEAWGGANRGMTAVRERREAHVDAALAELEIFCDDDTEGRCVDGLAACVIFLAGGALMRRKLAAENRLEEIELLVIEELPITTLTCL